ncbi:LacI family DNA-binding transcriptional regulator [Paenibacillus rhizophilus]|uniref:LacI family transcriptional regulator n=1 Tax=Paenibacillus rhizophilus TaxID=1850366 RepID=A0A3N9P2Y6_9BACL|nr:LacI family DNA-binding transcriptional regulator [Paenibacillus rhizophilus]RQW10538.1 LacI family transcriptional regulator [Paenibacillus rhizophilus]
MGYNIKEIASLAGVSKSTVSRVISGSGYASQAARERVMKVIETLQYKPSAVARAMVAQRTHNIGVIIFREQQPVVSHPLYGKIVDAILMAAGAKGYSVFLTTDHEMSLRSTDFMLEKRVDGLILISRLRQNVIDYVKSFNIPYLMVNGSTDDPEVVQIVSKDEEGGERAASYLNQLGHRQIFVIAGPQEHRSHNLRLKGFCSSMERLGNSGGLTVVSSPESSFDMGYRVMLEHWDFFKQGAFTSLFATNDMLALGAMKLLAERSVRVPEQIAVMGFDDIDFASMYSPSLTTVRVEKEKMGHDAIWMLDRLIRREDSLPKLNEYASELIIRQST